MSVLKTIGVKILTKQAVVVRRGQVLPAQASVPFYISFYERDTFTIRFFAGEKPVVSENARIADIEIKESVLGTNYHRAFPAEADVKVLEDYTLHVAVRDMRNIIQEERFMSVPVGCSSQDFIKPDKQSELRALAHKGIVWPGHHLKLEYDFGFVDCIFWPVDHVDEQLRGCSPRGIFIDERCTVSSPLGTALLGRRKGDTIKYPSPQGMLSCKISAVAYIKWLGFSQQKSASKGQINRSDRAGIFAGANAPSLDGSKDIGHFRRDNGQFGSFPGHDNYSDESSPDPIDQDTWVDIEDV